MIDHTIMVQGTSSDAGKSLVVTGLCRILARMEIKTAPFKPQNMALNSAVTPCGGEIGRAQAVQAMAAKVPLQVHFNPVLLKPNSDTGAQVIIQGRPLTDMEAASYQDYKKSAMDYVLQSHHKLVNEFRAIVVEGAGSPAEINLREGDIANMGFAEAVDCPVILVADIDRGGVFAQLIGTLALLSASEQNRVIGFIINKFRGDVELLKPGLQWLEQQTGKSVLGVLPYLQGLDIAAEDAIESQQNLTESRLKVAVPVFSRISNHTDFDALRLHPQISLKFVGPGQSLLGVDLIILPGSKNVRRDLDFARKQNWHMDIERHLRYGGKVLGICGGYQMLGELIDDPDGIESEPGCSVGLGLLPIKTKLTGSKKLTHTTGIINFGQGDAHVKGYEIHAGRSEIVGNCTKLIKCDSHFSEQQQESKSDCHIFDGCINLDSNVAGTYLHGLFDHAQVIQLLAKWVKVELDTTDDYQQLQEQAIDRLADAMSEHLDLPKIFSYLNLKDNNNG